MNRSNVGNVITNAQQILSVGATAGSATIRQIKRDIADESTKLLNQQKEAVQNQYLENRNKLQQQKLEQGEIKTAIMKAKQEKAEIQTKKTELAFQQQQMKAQEKAQKKEVKSVDELLQVNSPQAQATKEKVQSDLDWFDRRFAIKGSKIVDITTNRPVSTEQVIRAKQLSKKEK